MPTRRRSRWLAAAPLACASCDPLIDVAGAFFPAWILCIAGAIVATALLRLLFLRARIEPLLGPRILVYPSLATGLALAGWLLFFRR
jgi:hypothetical protein